MSCRGRCGVPGGADSSGNPPPTSHRPVYIDMDRTPASMGEYMTENYATEYPGYGGLRVPPSGRASTPGPYGYPSQYDTFGSQIEPNVSWIPKDINLSELLDQNGSSRLRRGEPPAPPAAKPPETTPSSPDPLLGPELSRDQYTPQSKKNEEKRRESLIQWFDRSVEKELKKHKESSIGAGIQYTGPVPNMEDQTPELNLSRGTLERLSGATASQVEICFDLRQQPDTELTDAVDKFAKAEAMCAFAGAVKAAEAAAVAAPPELIEAAALASAKGFQTELKTTGIHGELQGVRPIEVVGYVGVTKPKYPTRRH